MLTAKQLKKQWKARIEFGGYTGSFKDFLRDEAKRADDRERFRNDGETYADAAFLLLERKAA